MAGVDIIVSMTQVQKTQGRASRVLLLKVTVVIDGQE